MLFVLLNLISCDNACSAIYMTWVGNWSISHEKILVENPGQNSVAHVNDYWAIVTKKSVSEFAVNVYESPNNTDSPIFNFSTDFHSDHFEVIDGNNIYTYNVFTVSEGQIAVSGKFRDYTFHYVYDRNSRYQISVFNLKKHEWDFFNIIKDIDRREPTFFEEQFWLYFGYFFLSIFMFILYNFAFKCYAKLADKNERRIEKEKKLPKPEFEDVLTPGLVKKRTPQTYGGEE